MKKLLLLLLSVHFLTFLSAQPTADQSTYDLRFANSVVDCDGATPTFCVEVQIKSAIGGESFRIGSHTVFFGYNTASIKTPVFTSNLFNDTNLCLDEAFATYNEPAFSFDENTAEANFTTIAIQILTEDVCPLVADDWQAMATLCFEVVNDAVSTDLQFDTDLTTINYIDSAATNAAGDPQDKEAHTQGELTGLDILPICPCNQTIEQTIQAVQDYCGAATPDLATAESEIAYSGDGSVFSLEWFIDADYAMVYELEELEHSGTDICMPETFTLYAKATCSIDATEYDAGTLEVVVHPAPQMPQITRLDDYCAYLVIPACANDMLSETTFELMPSAEAAIRLITVTSPSNADCSENFEVPYETCPDPVCESSIAIPIAASQSFCEEGMPDLAAAELEIIFGGDASEFVIEWFEDQSFTMPYANQNLIHSQADLCAIERDTLFAKAICITDNTVVEAGFLAVELFPPLQSPTIARNDDNCTYTILPFCEMDVLSESEFSLMPASEAGTRNIMVTSSNSNCTASFEVEYEACPEPVCEQSIVQTINAMQSFCESGIPDLAAAELEVEYSGDGSVFVLEWFEDEDFTIAYDGSALERTIAGDCALEEKMLYARATCTTDGTVSNAGVLTLQLYPEPQAPTIERVNDNCDYQVIPHCEMDVLSETGFSEISGTDSGTKIVTVISGIGDEVCESIEFIVEYEACPELLCSQSITQTIELEEHFCESGIPDLAAAELEVAYSGDGSVFTLEWFEDEAFTIAYDGSVLERTIADDCALEEKMLYAQATCTTDGTVSSAGVLTLQLYPEPQAPTIERVNDNCDYQVIPHCEMDVLSETGFSEISGTDSGAKIVTVISGIGNEICESIEFIVEYEACPELLCSQSITQTFELEEHFCESGIPDLAAAELEVAYSGDGSVFTLEWFEDEVFAIPYIEETLSHSMEDICQVESEILYLRAICSEDASVQLAGTLEVILYPKPQAPTIVRVDDVCNYQVIPACEDDVLAETAFDIAPDSPEGSRTILVNSGVDQNPCGVESFEVNYEGCPPVFCGLEVVSAIPSGCDPETNTYDLEVMVTYGFVPNAPIAIDAIGVGTGGGMIDQSGAQTFVLEGLSADGEMGIDVVAGLVIGNICVDTLFNAYDAPMPCAGTPCDELEVGELPTDNQFVCFGDVIQITAANPIVPEGTALVYVLHSTPNNALSAPLAIRLDGMFDREEIPNVDFNIPYYITVLGGLDEDGNGVPDLENSACLKLSNPMPVVFLTEVVMGYDVTYYEDTQTFDISITASGGLPAYGAGFYQVSLSNGVETMINAPFQTVLLEGLNVPEENIGITVVDFAGCLATDLIAVDIESLPLLEDFQIAYSSNVELDLQFWSLENQELQLSLFDLTGRKLLEEELRLEQGFQRKMLSLMDLPVGMYLLRVGNGKDFVVRKVVR